MMCVSTGDAVPPRKWVADLVAQARVDSFRALM